jgi:hypothetical protein
MLGHSVIKLCISRDATMGVILEAVNDGNILEMTCREVMSAACNTVREIQENTRNESMIVLGS